MAKFIHARDDRFGVQMISDSRLANKQAEFCLCSSCLREDAVKGIECPTHTTFMRMTRILNLASPVFSCLLFVEDTSKPNKTDEFYEPSREKVEDLKQEIENLKDEHKKELANRFTQSFKEQKKLWGVDDNLQPTKK